MTNPEILWNEEATVLRDRDLRAPVPLGHGPVGSALRWST
jgi:hypothetical protein